MDEYIVLVNNKNHPKGTLPKLLAHNANTPLHRGFSVFLFDNLGNILLQQRSKNKITWPLAWSNSCCGHPKWKESSVHAAKRRLAFELNITDAKIYLALPNYKYRYEKNGVVENELCPVMVAFTSQKPRANHNEVEAIRWMKWIEWVKKAKTNPKNYTPWSIEETILLHKKIATIDNSTRIRKELWKKN